MAFTYFFRDIQTLKLITKEVLPTLRGYRYIHIWDAGCAHGPEPYSIAIMLRENMTHFLFRNVRIHATDIDTSDQFGRIIREGVYPAGEVKRIPSMIKEKYFAEADKPGHYRIDDEIRARIEFTRHDLLSLKPVRRDLGLIVCKNVLLHLRPAQRVDVIKMFHDSLREGGFLVTEQTQEMPHRVEHLFQHVTCKGQVFRKLNAHATERIAA
ncbi:MAG: chemotaxis protein CheR [Planctomycetes bacterium]|nr:chemotaxis protein CheR [Planctomycetota bacterium]